MRRAVDGGPRLWGRRIGDGTLTWPVNGMASRPPRIALGAGLVLLAHGLLWVGLSAALRTPPAARQAAATPPPLWLRWVALFVFIAAGITDFLDGYYLLKKSGFPAVYGQASGFLKHAQGEYAELKSYVQAQVRGLELAHAFLQVR